MELERDGPPLHRGGRVVAARHVRRQQRRDQHDALLRRRPQCVPPPRNADAGRPELTSRAPFAVQVQNACAAQTSVISYYDQKNLFKSWSIGPWRSKTMLQVSPGVCAGLWWRGLTSFADAARTVRRRAPAPHVPGQHRPEPVHVPHGAHDVRLCTGRGLAAPPLPDPLAPS